MVKSTATFDRQLPLLIRNLEIAMRSGYNVKQSFEILANDLPAPAGVEARWVVDEWDGGTPVPTIFEQWLARTPSRDLDLLIATIRLQEEVSGNLADMLQLLAQIMNKRQLVGSK